MKSQETNKILFQEVVGANVLYSLHNLKLQDKPSLLMSTSTSVSNTNFPSSAATINNNSSIVSNSVVSSSSITNLWHARS